MSARPTAGDGADRSQPGIVRRSVAVMVIASLASVGIATAILYRTALDGQLRSLAEAAESRAALLSALVRDSRSDSGEVVVPDPATALEALASLQPAAAASPRGTIRLARREGDAIVYLQDDRSERDSPPSTPESIPWESELGEPMRRALRGESGASVLRDAPGVEVLAGYRPLPELGWGVVAQIDLSEVRAPFVRASAVAFALALSVLVFGAFVEQRLVSPVVRRMGEDAGRLTQSILDTTIDAIITISADGTIESANREAIAFFGYEESELIGRNVSMLMPEPYSGHHPEFLQSYLETGQAKIIGIGREVPCLRKDGTTFPADLSVSEVRMGNRRHFTGILRNLSAQKKSEARLLAVEKRMEAAEELASVGTLVAGLAHEIGTPMGVIQGHARMLEKWVSNEQARWRLKTIQEQVGRISRIIQSLLNMARPKATERIPVALEPLIETTLSFLSEKLARRGVRVVRDFQPTGSVTGDPERLQQLLLNLLLNGIDAMPEGGNLTIRLRPDGKAGAVLEIADSGIGIEPENLGRIFEAFYTSKEAGKGNGLGLMVASRIVNDHRGTIEVESTLGQGTEFRIHFPWIPVYPPQAVGRNAPI